MTGKDSIILQKISTYIDDVAQYRALFPGSPLKFRTSRFPQYGFKLNAFPVS